LCIFYKRSKRDIFWNLTLWTNIASNLADGAGP
jgi:hypothetical protein